MNILRICTFCHAEFPIRSSEAVKGKGKFCSRKCSYSYQSISKQIERVCPVCTKTFITFPYHIRQGRGKICSPFCAGKWHSIKHGVQYICEQCSQSFSIPKHVAERRIRKFCSNECAHMSAHSPGKRQERFWSHVEKLPNGCWIWKGATNANGYGIFAANGKNIPAHRHAWELAHGLLLPFPWICILHRCDNPPCVNEAHLFPGTRYDNNIDRAKKGRAWAKLSIEQVQKLREMAQNEGYSYVELCALFGITIATVHNIVLRKTWRHI
jgi:hypothetical protein